MVIGYYNNGYVPVFSTNQGGAACSGGGAAANTINLSMATFSGAFRWHGWDYLFEEPEPEPTPEPTPKPADGKITYSYVKGDCFSRVLVKLGLDEGHLWGKDGTVAYYTQQLVEQGVLDARGNVKIGVPFTLTVR